MTTIYNWTPVPPAKVNNYSNDVRLGKAGRLSVPSLVTAKLGTHVEALLDLKRAVLGLRPVEKAHGNARKVESTKSKSGRASVNIKSVFSRVPNGSKLLGQKLDFEWQDGVFVLHLAVK